MRNTPLLALICSLLFPSLFLSSQDSSSQTARSAQPTQAAQSTATPGSSGELRFVDREEVADKIFPPLAVTSEGPSHSSRVILRFSDPDSEIVITTLLDGRRIVESYILDPGTTIESSIAQALQRNQQASLDQLASAIRVHTATIAVPQAQVARWFQDMNGVLPEKFPTTQIHLDGPPQFDLWIDANGDVIHYRFFEVPEQPHDGLFAPLARLMVKINSEVGNFRRREVRH